MSESGTRTGTELQRVLAALRGELRLAPAEVEPLGITAWNEHFKLTLDGQPQHLVIYKLPDPTATNGLIFEHRILRHLQQSFFALVPRLVIVNRDSLFPFDGGWFAITEWIPHCRSERDPPLTGGQIDSMAAGLSDLHRYLAPLQLSLAYHPDHVFVYPLPHFHMHFEQLVVRLGERLGGERFGEEARLGWRESRHRVHELVRDFPLDLYWQVRQEDPTGIVHGDFRGMNAAFDGDRLTHILDFNCCFNEIRLWDVAYTALGLGGKETVGLLSDLERPARFVRAYHRAGRLTPAERRLLAPMLCFVVAKLIVGAVEGWWITDRAKMLADLVDGGAAEIVRLAGLADS